MSQTILLPDLDQPGLQQGRWMLVIHNNETNSYESVVLILIAATNCSVEEAEIETWEAHHYGKAAVHFASKEECEEAGRIVSSIGVNTEVQPEWND